MDANTNFKTNDGIMNLWALSSFGRALALHAGGKEFESPRVQGLVKMTAVVLAVFCLLILFPNTSRAAGEETFTLEDNLGKIDKKYTDALHDGNAKRLLLNPRLVPSPISKESFEETACEAQALVRKHNLKFSSSACAAASNAVFVAGLEYDYTKHTYLGKIFRVQNDNLSEIQTNGKLDGDFGGILLGVKNSGNLLIMRAVGSEWRAWEINGDVWTQFPADKITRLDLYTNSSLAWSGKHWYALKGVKLLLLYDKSAIQVEVPGLTNSLIGLTTSSNEPGLFIKSGRSPNFNYHRLKDDGFYQSQTAESNSVRTKEPVVWAKLDRIDAETPLNTYLIFSVSNDGGKNWKSIEPGQETTFHIEENLEARLLKFRVFLATNDANLTPILRSVKFQYTTQNPFSQAVASRDRKRVSDLENVKRQLTKYKEAAKIVPTVDRNISPEDQWRLLEDILISGVRNKRLNIQISIPKQASDLESQFKYHYAGGGVDYVLWVTLEDRTNRALSDEHDGIVLNVPCDDPIFCLSSLPLPEKPKTVKQTPERPRQKEKERLVRVIGDSKIWLITKNGLKRYLGSLERFRYYVKFLGQINPISEYNLNQFPENNLLRASGETKVYYVWNRNRRWIISPQVFEKYGFKWEDIATVPKEELEEYKELAPVER